MISVYVKFATKADTRVLMDRFGNLQVYLGDLPEFQPLSRQQILVPLAAMEVTQWLYSLGKSLLSLQRLYFQISKEKIT